MKEITFKTQFFCISFPIFIASTSAQVPNIDGKEKILFKQKISGSLNFC